MKIIETKSTSRKKNKAAKGAKKELAKLNNLALDNLNISGNFNKTFN